MIIRTQTVRFSPDRKPIPRKIKLGFEGDNMVERLVFDLPAIAHSQTATLMMGGRYANAVQLAGDGEEYRIDLTAEIVGAEGEIEAYVRIDGESGEVWHSNVLRLITGDVPDVETEIETRYPSAVETMLAEMAGHRVEMDNQTERAEEAARRAEEAAERAESAEPGNGGGISEEADPTVPAWAKQPEKPKYTAAEVGADTKGTAAAEAGRALEAAQAYADRQIAAIPVPDVSGQIGKHDESRAAHADIRALITGLTNRLNALADSDDTTLDQLSEIIVYIKNNKNLIDAITTGKVSTGDIINNLTTNAAGKPLSAAQGVVLKAMIEAITVPTALSQLTGDAAHRTVTDSEKAVWNGKLDENKLPEAVSDALSQAKESGEFDGKDGNPGADGVSPTVSVSKSGKVTTISITDKNGTKTATVNDGADGAAGSPGKDGKDGTSVAVTNVSMSGADGGSNIVTFSDGKTLTVKNGSKGSSGVTGTRGMGILMITTAPSGYTTAAGGFTPAYRVALSTVKTQSHASEVLVGDTIQYSYYHYPVGYVDSSYVYMGARNSIRGATGAAGSDATVTKESIEAALGYTPAGGGTESPLTGKKIVYDGDSICAAVFSYPKLIADKTACIFDNQAVGGARLCAASDKHSVVNNLPNLPTDGDIYCFQGGINDWWGNTPLGTYTQGDYTGTVDPATIYGAMETIFRYALTNFFGKAICFVITHKVQNAAYSKNTAGNTFWDYRKAMIDVCEKYSIPYYDAFTKSGLNGWHTGQKAGLFVSGDGTHPNEKAYEAYYVPQLIDLFESIVPAGDYEAPVKPVTYTNMLKLAVDSSGNPYNGGKGYKDNIYLSYDGNTESAATSYDATGYIPAKIGDIIRLKNVQLCKVTNSSSKSMVTCHKGDFTHIASSPALTDPTVPSEYWAVVANEAGTDIIQFTVPTAYSASLAYIRICCGALTDASIITVNEEID